MRCTLQNLKIGDRVRKINNINIKGKVVCITERVTPNFLINVAIKCERGSYVECNANPDDWDKYFDVGDIVDYVGHPYRIVYCYPITGSYDIENYLGEYQYGVSSDAVTTASEEQKLAFYDCKKAHENLKRRRFDSIMSNKQLKHIEQSIQSDSLCKAYSISKKFNKVNTYLTKGEFDAMDRFILTGIPEGYRIPLEFKKVIYNDPATIVIWKFGSKTVVRCDGFKTITNKDGSKTVVKYSEGEKYDELKGLMMCIIKKFYGLKEFYKVYDDAVKYVTDEETKLNIEKGLAVSFVKKLYNIKKIDSVEDIYKVAKVD